MVFGIFLLCCNLILPITMLAFGMVFSKQAPGKINGVYGYRTRMSMLNQETWNFAHKYCGMVWKRMGIVMLLISIGGSVWILWMSGDVQRQGLISCVLEVIQVVILVGCIFPVEQALKKRFDKDGNRRDF